MHNFMHFDSQFAFQKKSFTTKLLIILHNFLAWLLLM